MEFKAGQTVKVTVAKAVSRAAARKTLERVFMRDKGFAAPIEARSANFEALPKRRGGRIWTKYPNKIHGNISKGAHATVTVTAQVLKDLKSVEDLVQVATA
jgi:hypothetical protein